VRLECRTDLCCGSRNRAERHCRYRRRAGLGKTKTLVPIVEAWQVAWHRVIGTAIAWRVARALQQDLNIEARATASWVERLKRGERFLDERSVLIVDEAGSISRPVDIKLRRGPAFHLLARR